MVHAPGGRSSLTWVRVSILKDGFSMNVFSSERSKMVLISAVSRLGTEKSRLRNFRNFGPLYDLFLVHFAEISVQMRRGPLVPFAREG